LCQTTSIGTDIHCYKEHQLSDIGSLRDFTLLKSVFFFASMSVLFQDQGVSGGSPRHSIASNNSSNPSTPPSPGHDHGSSSYDS